MAQDPHGPGLIATTVNFFSYFTIRVNTLAVLTMLVPLIVPDSGAGRFLSKPSVRTANASYLIIVGVVYFMFLRHLEVHLDWEVIADHLLHYATPVLFTIDWLVFVPKGQVPWKVIRNISCHPFPLWHLDDRARCPDQLVPYSFLDLPELGYAKAFANHGWLHRHVHCGRTGAGGD